MSDSGDYRVDYQGVRVSAWYMAKTLLENRGDFREKLGTEFIPAIVQFMSPQGLTAYIPSVIPDDPCEEVPDETAIVFFSSREVYYNRTRTTGGKLFGYDLHQVVFDMDGTTPYERRSFTDFPKLMGDDIWIKTPYYLFDNKVDWMKGQNDHYIGVREDPKQTMSEFLEIVQVQMANLQNNLPRGLEGFLFVVTNKCLIYWVNWANEKDVDPDLLSHLRGQLREVLNTTSVPTDIPTSTADEFKGLKLYEGNSISTQFERQDPPSFMLD
ncbi:MAG: hypothetical protein HQL69_08360 [Magnetococcales bacterium]|nr:hypothetical protein [Magnetococcales bacterium]